MRRFKLFLIAFCSLLFNLSAQEGNLPHCPTTIEEKQMGDYLEILKTRSALSIPSPPPGEVRTMAEWEQIQALIITWAGQSAILREIVRHAVNECKVLIITDNPGNVSATLTNAGILLDSVRFVDSPYNSIWVRDYGPWTVYQNDVDSLFLIDWIYNRPRPDDDLVPAAIADYLGLPMYEATVDPDDFVHTGGNHLPDGMGTAFSSMLVLEENADKTEAEIDSIAFDYLGVRNYVKFPTLPFDGIHHLDMHMRIIDEETIIFGEYPEGIADGPQINANIQYLEDEVSTSFGNKYRIIRMPMPPEGDRFPDQGGDYRTYTNSIFINKTLLVPTYEEKYDTTALRIYRENLPGYNVVGINCNSIIPSLGAIHCIAKLVGVADPLLIAHARLRDIYNTGNEYPVAAFIKHKSGIASAELYYRKLGDSLYLNIPMKSQDTLNDEWIAAIPPHASGTEIQYYIHALSNSGKEQVRPIVAPEGYFNFRIHGEAVNQPPVVNITYPLDGAIFSIDDIKANIEINATDADGDIEELSIYINGDSISLIDTFPYTYEWTFPAEGDYAISVKATDDKGAETVSDLVHVTIESTTATEPVGNARIHAYPNPVEDVLWIQNEGMIISVLSVTNSLGKYLQLPQINSESILSLDFSGLPMGIYFVKGLRDSYPFTIKVVKQ